MNAVEFALDGIWQWAVWLAAAATLASLGFLELRRANKRQLALRLAATAVATLSLAMLCLEPMYWAEERASEAFLLTSNFSAERVQAAAESLRPAHRFALPRASSSEKISGVVPLPNLPTLARQYPHIRRLHLFGDGLRPDELALLDRLALTLHLNALPDGVTVASFPTRIALGEALRAQGTWHAPRRDSLWLYLEGGGMRADSALLVGEGELPFELFATPKQAGEWLYKLYAVRAARDTAFVGIVPIHVSAPKSIRVLIVERAPSFETRAFKQWASATDNALAIRSALSRGKFFTEFLNLSPLALERLTTAVLDKVDVVIMDFESLVGLGASEQAALRQAVENGLGVLIVLSDAPTKNQAKTHHFFLGFFATMPEKGGARYAKPQGMSPKASASAALPIAPLRLQEGFAAEVIVRDEAEQALVIAGVRGLGKVAVSIVEETFRWALEGKSDLYANYWSRVLTRLARPRAQTDIWQVATPLPTVDLPCHLTLRTLAPKPIALVAYPSGALDTLFFKQSLVEPALWETTFWAREQGWHRILRLDDHDSVSLAFYAHLDTEWLSLRRAAMQTATRVFAQTRGQEANQADVAQVRRPVPQWWFFALFVIAAGYLWAERQL